MTGDGVIVILYGVRATSSGWVPALVLNGKERCGWQPGGYDKATALSMAEAQAREEAARYVGDWDVRVTKEAP